jgi:hypothetical protein
MPASARRHGRERRSSKGRLRASLVAAVVAAASAVVPNVTAQPPPPIQIEIGPPAPGLPAPFDPPLILLPDERLLTLDVPSHPWMLINDSELPALRDRIREAEPGSIIAAAWERFLSGVDDPAFRDRDGLMAGLSDPTSRRWGRDDVLNTGLVWKITGDSEYLELTETLIAYATSLTPDYGAPIEPGVDEYYIQRAHRLNGFALAYDLLYEDLSPLARTQLRGIVETLANQHFVHANTSWWGLLSSGSNIGGMNAAALGTAALALYNENPAAPLWLMRAEMLVRGYFHAGFDPEGSGIEGVLYANYGMRITTYLLHALERVGFDGLRQEGGIPRHQHGFAYEVLPGGGAVNPLNDARYYEINPTFTTWSIAHGDYPELSAWLFDNMYALVPGEQRQVGGLPTLLWYRPSDPAFDPSDMLPLAQGFVERRGLVHVRTGWGADDFMASFEARQTDWGQGVHQNQDIGQFTLYEGGAKLIVDSRYANWLEKMVALDFEAMRSSESEAHNLVVADGRSQDFWARGTLTGFATTINGPGEAGSIDIASSDARLAWILDQPEQADRCFLYSRSAPGSPINYLVVTDQMVQGGSSHTYTSYLHTDWRNTASVHEGAGSGIVRIESGEVDGVSLSIDLNVEGDSRTRIGSFTPDDAQDWARLGLPGRKAHPRVETTHDGDAYRAINVMIPTASGEEAPPVARIAATGGIASQVDHGRAVDTILLANGSEAPVAAAGIETDAGCALVRMQDGAVTRIAFSGGTYVDVNGVRVMQARGGPGTVAWADDPSDEAGAPAGSTLEAQALAAALDEQSSVALPATGGGAVTAGATLVALAVLLHALAARLPKRRLRA